MKSLGYVLKQFAAAWRRFTRKLKRKLRIARPALLIGITGSIACGKSVVGEMLKESGVLVIDTDHLVHELYSGPNPTYDAILKRFGKEMATHPGGPIDRTRLAVVFKDTAARRDLEAITHPAVMALLQRRAAQAARNQVVAVLVPLLFEAQLQEYFEETWAIIVRPDVQLERLMKRNGLSEAEAKARIAAQWSQDKKAALAKRVIDNSGTLDVTRKSVNQQLLCAKREFNIA